MGANIHSFELTIRAGESGLHVENDNVDVEITLENGEKYSATFFTLTNIEMLFKKNRLTGECNAGLYFWATDMILVETLTEKVIRDAIIGLIFSDEIGTALTKL
ncbi:MAG: hypothetical protein V4805_09600 [Pseudomonadota bacterium]